MSARFCKDCRHRVLQDTVLGGTGVELRCARWSDSVREEVDLVTGARRTTMRLEDCYVERSGHRADSCGPDGRFFEEGPERGRVDLFARWQR